MISAITRRNAWQAIDRSLRRRLKGEQDVPTNPWTQPSTTPSPSLAEGVFTVTHPFHPLCGQQFEMLSYRHNWGEYRVTFYQTPDRVRALPATWTSLAPSDPSVILAAGRAAFRVADLLQLS